MRTKIGIYVYNRVSDDQIIILHNDGLEQPTERVVMFFVKQGMQLLAQGGIDDDDYIEMYSNAVKIFRGEIG